MRSITSFFLRGQGLNQEQVKHDAYSLPQTIPVSQEKKTGPGSSVQSFTDTSLPCTLIHVTLFDLSWEHVHQAAQIFHSGLHMPGNDRTPSELLILKWQINLSESESQIRNPWIMKINCTWWTYHFSLGCHLLVQWWANSFWKEPDSSRVKLFGPNELCCNCSALHLWWKQLQIIYVNE